MTDENKVDCNHNIAYRIAKEYAEVFQEDVNYCYCLGCGIEVLISDSSDKYKELEPCKLEITVISENQQHYFNKHNLFKKVKN